MRASRVLALLLVLGLVGCGGSHNDAVPALGVSGQVTLPAGTALTLGSLRVVTPTGTYPVRNDGSFDAGELANGMAAVMLTDATGRVILMGHADANDPTAAVVNAEETAVALLLEALVGFLPSYEYLPDVRELVRDATQTDDLAAVISARVSADPLALSKGDAAIIAAITDAMNDLVAAAGGAQARSALAATMRPAAADGSVWITKDITPATRQSGLLLQQTTDTNAVQFTNYFRRHAFWRAYRTGYTGADGAPQQVTPWEEVTAEYQDRYLQATNGLDGVLGTLVGLVGSQVPYAPNPGWPFDLPRLPVDASESAYKIIVVGASFRGGTVESQFPADAGLTAQHRQDLLTDYSLAVAATAFMDMAMPIICQVIPADALAHGMTNKQQAKLIQSFATALIRLHPAFASELASGDVKGACTQIVQSLATNPAARDAMIQVLTSEKFLQVTITSGMTQAMGEAIAKKCTLYLALADGLMTAFDLGVVSKDLATADAVALWTAKSVSPDVTLSPAASTIKPGETVDLTCEVTAGLKGTLEYEWATSGGHGHLTDTMGHSGVAFTSSRPAVTFVADTDLALKVTDPVEVKVYRRSGSSRAYVGTATANVTIEEKVPFAPRWVITTLSGFPATGTWWGETRKYMVYKASAAVPLFGVAHYPDIYYSGLLMDGRHIAIDLSSPPQPGPSSTLEWTSYSRDAFVANFPAQAEQVDPDVGERIVQVGGTSIEYAESVWSAAPDTWRTRLEGDLAVAAANLTSLTFDFDYYQE